MIKRALIATIILSGTIAVLTLYLPSNRTPPPSAPTMVSGEVRIGGPFTLVSTAGTTVNEDVLLGHYSLIYFGFTHCPDICPLALQGITEALDTLGPAGDGILPVFITLDPERDTPEVMADYVANFHPRFIGLNGSLEQIEAAMQQYKVYARKAFAKDADGNNTDHYLVDHTGFTYLMDPSGRYAHHFSKGVTAQEMAAHIKQFVAAP
jgi:cytochrome oxidase Cu insertion factor (SCO1/SenC/PrrC family)